MDSRYSSIKGSVAVEAAMPGEFWRQASGGEGKNAEVIGVMARITIYLNDDVERKVRKAAKSAKVSVSKWIADRVAQAAQDSWPVEFLELAGAFPDFPEAEDLRKGYGEDVPRENLRKSVLGPG